ncbi:DUF1345 domain-containing protein [Streptomyces sp. NBC_01456]|uniref:hypothetical protein n=1 Tax=unclassified Streptomyces TaxID=2593676 RepID=UPI002E34E020|nr:MULTISPECIES: hypothetical protein [unclassified Streptomyces]
MSHDPKPGEPSDADSERLARIEAMLAPAVSGMEQAGRRLLPAWRRVTRGEPRWPSTLAVLVAVALQWLLPERLAIHPEWLLATLETALLIALVAANPFRIERGSRLYRWAGLVLIAMISAANGWSAVHLVIGLVRGSEGSDAGPLLMTGGSIWATNVIVFALWYWEWDRGGPVARARAVRAHVDFLFPQMQALELAPEHWEPQFPDYLYLSFTNATAFSPTDVMPLTRWAKMLMLVQSAVSLLTVVLVVARAVNILK